MLTVKEAADRLGCSTSLVYEILRSGKLRHRLIGKKHIRIEEKDFDAYLEKTMLGEVDDKY
jgi:excisionase family DNA binding protein